VSALFKCLRCEAVFPYEEQRFEGPSVSCTECRSNQVVEFFVHSAVPAGTGSGGGSSSSAAEQDSKGKSGGSGAVDTARSTTAPLSPTSSGGGSTAGEGVPYSVIPEDEEVDCRAVDHQRKLVLDLEHFEDGERCLGGIECAIFTKSVVPPLLPPPPPLPCARTHTHTHTHTHIHTHTQGDWRGSWVHLFVDAGAACVFSP
jgi:DNA-directed RNA polymerase subunit RPC12/RpoP